MQRSATDEELHRLVIAYAFAPYADTSAVVAAKRVHEHGRVVDVVHNAMDEIRGRDETLETLVSPLVAHRALIGSQPRFGSWKAIVQFCEEGLATIESWQSAGRRYDTLYSRAHFVASNFLAALVKLRNPEIVWEAEFSDSLARKAHGEPRSQETRESPLRTEMQQAAAAGGTSNPSSLVFQLCEQVTIALADRLMFTNDAQRDDVLSRCQTPAIAAAAEAKSTIAPHPAPPAWAYDAVQPDHPLAPDRCHIGYFGNFYSSQRPDTLLRAVAEMAESDRARIQLHLFTGDEKLAAAIDAHRVGDVVRIAPRLPYLEFLALSRRMDVLLAVDAATPPGLDRNPVRLSKWSDYQGSGTAVWGVVEEGSELAAQDLRWRSPLGHVTAALSVLTSLARAA